MEGAGVISTSWAKATAGHSASTSSDVATARRAHLPGRPGLRTAGRILAADSFPPTSRRVRAWSARRSARTPKSDRTGPMGVPEPIEKEMVSFAGDFRRVDGLSKRAVGAAVAGAVVNEDRDSAGGGSPQRTITAAEHGRAVRERREVRSAPTTQPPEPEVKVRDLTVYDRASASALVMGWTQMSTPAPKMALRGSSRLVCSRERPDERRGRAFPPVPGPEAPAAGPGPPRPCRASPPGPLELPALREALLPGEQLARAAQGGVGRSHQPVDRRFKERASSLRDRTLASGCASPRPGGRCNGKSGCCRSPTPPAS
jgi:hypothetical protein